MSTEQEYESADIMDEGVEPPDTPSGPGPYPGAPYVTDEQHQPMNLSSPTTTGPMDGGQQQQHQPGQQHGMSMSQMMDPSVEWDPFGLTASMAFPTQFTFDTSNMR